MPNIVPSKHTHNIPIYNNPVDCPDDPTPATNQPDEVINIEDDNRSRLYITISKSELAILREDAKVGRRIKMKLTKKVRVNSTWSPLPWNCYDTCPKAST